MKLETLSIHIKERHSAGECYQAIADDLGISKAMAHQIEHGHKPGPDVAKKLKLDPSAKVLRDRDRRKAQREELERLRIENEAMELALRKIKQWIKYYPIETFKEPNWKEVRDVLATANITVDCVTASCFRILLDRLYASCDIKPDK